MTLDPAARLALHELSARYAAAVDRRDLAGVAGLFHPAGTLVVPDPRAPVNANRDTDQDTDHVGHAAIAAAMEPVLHLSRTVHLVGGIVVATEPHDDRVTGRVTCVAHHFSPDPETGGHHDLVWYLHYEDTYRQQTRADLGWCFDTRRVVVDAVATTQVRHVRRA